MVLQLSNLLKKFDVSFFLSMICISIVGFINLYSAVKYQPTLYLFQNQILWFGIAFLVGIFVSFIHPKNLFGLSYRIYLFNVLALLLVVVLGKVGMGAQRWLAIGPVRFQPSEFMKISVVLALARWFAVNSPIKELYLRDLLIPGLITMIPAGLIMAQPDLGTGGVLILIAGVIVYFRKLSWKSIFKIIMIGLICFSIMYKFVLRDYQRQRIRTFINPQADARGSGYNAIQSEIAIGSGKVFGKGYGKSSQASLNFLPENHTDFVFSVLCEELGFIGGSLLISLFGLLLLRFIWLARNVNSLYDSLVCIGLMAIVFWHTFINIAMASGIFPIVGLPLPFISYGGSSLLTFGICMGIATSMSNTRSIF